MAFTNDWPILLLWFFIAMLMWFVGYAIGRFYMLARAKKKPTENTYERTLTFYIPAEHWSAFSEKFIVLTSYRDSGDIRNYTKDKPAVEWTTGPDFIYDGMWLSAVIRKEEWVDYLKRSADEINRNAERAIVLYDGGLPEAVEEMYSS